MKKKATRTYRDLKGRTTEKSRVRRYDRIPGDQFDADKALGEGYLNVEEGAGLDVAEEVDPADVEVVTERVPPPVEPEPTAEDVGETAEDHPYEGTPAEEEEGHQETEKEEQDDMDYAEGMEVKDADIEEAYYGDDKPGEAEATVDGREEEDDDTSPKKEEACGPTEKESALLKRSEGSFADQLRIAMEPELGEEELAADLGEEMAIEAPPVEGPCPAGCEPVTTEEAPPAEGEGILEVGEDDVTFLEEEPREGATEEGEVTADAESTEEVTADSEKVPAPDADESIYETLGTIEALGDVGAERVDLILTNEESEDPQYVVLVDGDPLAKVALSDQPENLVAEHGLFLDDDYPKFVLENIDALGLGETLKYVNARYYTASVLEGEVAQKMRTAAVNDLKGDHRQRLAEMKDHLINTSNIVLEGSLKNYITTNPLRDALVSKMRSVNVDENSALDIVEAAFREKGSDFFRAILKKAEEWIGAPQEVLEHHIKEISSMDYRHPGYVREETEEIPVEQQVIEAASVPANVPIRTIASARQQQGDYSYREQMKRELNLHGLLVQKSLANRTS